jgi:hypothetical protein
MKDKIIRIDCLSEESFSFASEESLGFVFSFTSNIKIEKCLFILRSLFLK